MTFAEPRYLLLLVLLPIAVGLAYMAVRERRAALDRVGAQELVRRLTAATNTRGRSIAQIMTIAAVGLAVISLARPQWGEETQLVEREGVQIMIALDVSKSMLAEDIKPNRLTRAKLEVSEIISKLQGDEVGLVLFAGQAFVQFPLTFDHAAARTFLYDAEPDLIPSQGTVLEEAINLSLERLDDQRPSQKVILILSDGEDHGDNALSAARRAADAGAVVYTIGVGSNDGAPIPRRSDSGLFIGFTFDQEGNRVLTRADKAGLSRIAEAGGGRLIQGSGRRTAADDFIRELSALQTATVDTELQVGRIERFQLFAGAAIALLFGGALIPDRRAVRRVQRAVRVSP